MTFSTNLPHPPFFSEPTWADRLPADDLELSPSYYQETFANKPAFQQEHATDSNHGAHDEAGQRAELAQYYTMIAEYELLGIWDDSVVLFLADHGDMVGGHKMRLKGIFPYEELHRIPCMLKLPKSTSPVLQTVDDLVSSIQAPADECVFFEHYAAYWGIHPFYAIRTPQFKYARYYGQDACEEMYDLHADPHELTNIAAEPTYAEQRAGLSRRADTWWRNTNGRDLAYYESDAFKANEHNVPD